MHLLWHWLSGQSHPSGWEAPTEFSEPHDQLKINTNWLLRYKIYPHNLCKAVFNDLFKIIYPMRKMSSESSAYTSIIDIAVVQTQVLKHCSNILIFCLWNDSVQKNWKHIHSNLFIYLKGVSWNLTSSLSIKSLCRDRINFINKDDGWGIFLGKPEDITYHTWSFSQVLLHKLRSNYTDECSWKIDTRH